MPDEISPIEGQPWPQANYYDDAPLWAPSGVVDTQQATPSAGGLGLSFGVAGSVVTASVALGRARVRGMRYRRTVTPWSQTIALNSTGNSRRDRIVLRRDLAAKTCTPVWLQGTPAASPTAPTLTQVEAGVWDMPLFSFTVPAGSSTSIANITDERDWLNADGSGLIPKMLTWQAGSNWGILTGSGYARPAYYRTGDGVVRGSGAVKSLAAIAANAVVATLDVGYRPTTVLPVQLPATSSSGQIRWDIQPNGNVLQVGALVSDIVVFLDGLSFIPTTLAAS